MKKYLCVMLSVMMLLTIFVGCKKETTDNSSTPSDEIVESQDESSEESSDKAESEDAKTESGDNVSSGSNSENSSESTPASKPQKNEETPSQPTACTHNKTKAVPVYTGSNIIDDSKLDMVNHSKVCELCGANIGLEAHTVSQNQCTVCGQDNFAVSNIYAIDAGVCDKTYGDPRINANGSVDYDLMIERCWWNADGEWMDSHNVKIPEAEMLKAIQKTFIISDAEFAKLKQQGVYKCTMGEQKYSDGFFYCKDPAAGGFDEKQHKVIGYKDDKKGTLTIYYDFYLKYDANGNESPQHQYYYTVEYTYSGASNFTVSEEDYMYIISGWKPSVDSLRVKAIRKVDDIAGITPIK